MSIGTSARRSSPPPALRKRFGALVVLDDVDFALGAGEAVGIVGPNGAGKTTLLNVLAGALRPTAGAVALPRRATSRPPAPPSAAGSGSRARTRCRGRSAA